ncbi:uncharacterized protein [Littorina saxatilis]|uniref:Uncharacterized protein n=1 Tax=Littorina saxatilis TaxID=31220 RepID=A0AAN9G637_9CAEN
MLTMSVRTWSLVLVTVVGALLGRHQTHAKVNYKCVYGPVLSTEDASGNTHHFCATEMRPPFMQLGAYVIARDGAGMCYECVCERENNIGMACCETPCQRT